MREEAEQTSELSKLVAGQFQESQHGDTVFYVEHLSDDQTRMENVFVQNRTQGKLTVLSSEYARRVTNEETGDRFMVMENGYRYDGSPGDADYRIVNFDKHAVRIEEKGVVKRDQRLEAIPTEVLVDSTVDKHRAELQWRISMPVSALLLALLAVPLSKANPREGRYARFFVAILVYIVYSNMMGVARDMVKSDEIWRPIGMWWIHVLMLFTIVALLIFQLGPRWCFDQMLRRPARRTTA
jgi:lipopolysaccharide export system permease protein